MLTSYTSPLAVFVLLIRVISAYGALVRIASRTATGTSSIVSVFVVALAVRVIFRIDVGTTWPLAPTRISTGLPSTMAWNAQPPYPVGVHVTFVTPEAP